MLKKADKMFEKLGFAKTHESNIVVEYEKKNEKFNYIQCITICRKKSGQHNISSYQKDCNKDGFNNSVGMTIKESKAALRKAKEMGLK